MEKSKPGLGVVARFVDEFILAMTLLTRIPMPPAKAFDEAALGRAIWAYPLVGALVGGIGAATYWCLTHVTVDTHAAAWFALAAMVFATGCFHEDGLADYWDGIGGGQTTARKLEIMRDSRIGSYGGAALILSLGARAALIGALGAKGYAELGLIAAGLVGRTSIAGVLISLSPARTDGLSTTAADPPRLRALVALSWSSVAFLLFQSFAAMVALGAAVVATAWMIRLTRRQIEGYTGDALGATEQTVEVAVLLALAASIA